MSRQSPAAPPIIVTKATSYRVPAALIGPPHTHPREWQILYVVAGEGQVCLGERWHTVRPRDLYLIKPGQRHASEDAADARPELWEIRLRVKSRAVLPAPLPVLPDLLREVREPALLETMRQLIDEHSSRLEHAEWLCATLAQELLLRLLRLAETPSAAAPGPVHRLHIEAMAHVRRYIHFYFAEPLSVGTLAREAGMSPRRFAAVFREVCGKPPMDYVIGVRLDRAVELLREGRLTVSEVAARTGFATVHYFSRVFRQRRGVPPSRHLPASA